MGQDSLSEPLKPTRRTQNTVQGTSGTDYQETPLEVILIQVPLHKLNEFLFFNIKFPMFILQFLM